MSMEYKDHQTVEEGNHMKEKDKSKQRLQSKQRQSGNRREQQNKKPLTDTLSSEMILHS